MPRVETPKHRVQRAFAPLLFRSHFQSERCLTHPALPWHATFPPHGDGIPVEDVPLSEQVSPASQVTLSKKLRPPGEPGRKGERGFNLKLELDLPEVVYEEILVGLFQYVIIMPDPLPIGKSP